MNRLGMEVIGCTDLWRWLIRGSKLCGMSPQVVNLQDRCEGGAASIVATDCTCQLDQEKDHKVKERESQNGDPNRPNTCPTLMLYRFGYLL